LSSTLRATDLQVLHHDAHFLALDKPSGIATTAPTGGHSLFVLAQALDPRAPQLHPLSRLDTQVSGLVVFARTAEANGAVLAARREGRLFRRYLGLVAAPPLASQGDWYWSIGIDRRDPRQRCAIAPDAPNAHASGVKTAHTKYALRAATATLAALDLLPQTGRTHQLRVHAAAAGVPLLGDVAYGGTRRLTLSNGRVLSAGRVMLHCAAVKLPHPDAAVGELSLTLAAPADMQQLWSAAGGASGAL
jgi:23S rRNA-/tRNA-specific pseudouridylate synthase